MVRFAGTTLNRKICGVPHVGRAEIWEMVGLWKPFLEEGRSLGPCWLGTQSPCPCYVSPCVQGPSPLVARGHLPGTAVSRGAETREEGEGILLQGRVKG